MQYDAFISYSTAGDDRLAPQLQLGLEKLAKPWSKRRSLRVFRDKSGLGVTPHLWDSIVVALDDTRYFVLLASPEAAESEWVNLEVEHWLQSAPDARERVLPVLTSGTWDWNDDAGTFTDESTAVPAALRGAFTTEPRYLDLTWARHDEHLDLRRAEFRAAVADLAAPIHGVPKDELESEDIRAHRRTVRLRRTAVGSLVVFAVAIAALAVAALIQASIARDNEKLAKANEEIAVLEAARADTNAKTAEANAKTADARRIAAQAELLVEDQTDLAALLARESLNIDETTEGRSALAKVMTIPVRATTLPPAEAAEELPPLFDSFYDSDADGPNGRQARIEAAGAGSRVRLTNASGQEVPISPIADAGPLRAVAFSADGETVFTGGDSGVLTAWSATTGQRLSGWRTPCATESCALSTWINDLDVAADGRLAVATFSGVWVFDSDGFPDSVVALSGPPGAIGVGFDASGSSLKVGYRDQSVRRYEFAAAPPTTSDHPASVFAIDASADGAVVASGDLAGTVQVVDNRPGGTPRTLRHGDEPVTVPVADRLPPPPLLISIAVDPTGRYVASAGYRSDHVSLWDLDTNQQTEIPLANVFDVAFAPDGSLALAVADGGIEGLGANSLLGLFGTGRVMWWDATSQRLESLMELPAQVLSVDVDPSGTEVVAGTIGGEVWVVDRESNAPIRLPIQAEILDWVFRLRYSSDGRKIAASGNGGEIALWELDGPDDPLVLLGHDGVVHGLAFVDDDTALASVGVNDGNIRMWNTETGAELGFGRSMDTSLGDVVVGPEGTLIVTTGDGSLNIVGQSPNIEYGTRGGRARWSGPASWEAGVCAVAGRNLTASEWARYIDTVPRRATCPEYPLE